MRKTPVIRSVRKLISNEDISLYIITPLIGGILNLAWFRVTYHFYTAWQILSIFMFGALLVLISILFGKTIKELTI